MRASATGRKVVAAKISHKLYCKFCMAATDAHVGRPFQIQTPTEALLTYVLYVYVRFKK